MSNATQRNDDSVLGTLMEARRIMEEEVAKDNADGRGPTRHQVRKLKGPVSLSVLSLARRTTLTEGKVQGALKRLMAEGLVETACHSNRYGSEYATVAEMAAYRVRLEDERRAELLERYGSVENMLRKIKARAERLNEATCDLLTASKEADVLGLADILRSLGKALGYRGLDLDDDDDYKSLKS